MLISWSGKTRFLHREKCDFFIGKSANFLSREMGVTASSHETKQTWPAWWGCVFLVAKSMISLSGKMWFLYREKCDFLIEKNVISWSGKTRFLDRKKWVFLGSKNNIFGARQALLCNWKRAYLLQGGGRAGGRHYRPLKFTLNLYFLFLLEEIAIARMTQMRWARGWTGIPPSGWGVRGRRPRFLGSPVLSGCVSCGSWVLLCRGSWVSVVLPCGANGPPPVRLNFHFPKT